MTRSAAVAALAIGLALPASAHGSVISGFFNDPANVALVASDGYEDFQAPRFGSPDEIARNVAVYDLTLTAPGTVDFSSTGFAAGGAEPYLSLFSGGGKTATFQGSNALDPNIDFSLSFSPLAAGAYTFTVGVWMNMSFAENNPDADPTLGDAFTALGDPSRLGSTFYDITVSSPQAIFHIAPASGLIGPPTRVPEPQTAWLLLASLALMCRWQQRTPRRGRARRECSEDKERR